MKTITILKRPTTLTTDSSEELSRMIYPKLPLHKRWEIYVQKRNEIFKGSDISSIKSPKRSTIRLRRYFRLRKICGKIQISTIISNPKDSRYYARVSFLNFQEFGLLDTGANVSCIGGDLAQQDFSKYPNFSHCKSYVKTADGKSQSVLGWIKVNITFKDKTHEIRLFIIPTISQRLILGIDFWQSFNLLNNLLVPNDIVSFNNNNICVPNVQELNLPTKTNGEDAHLNLTPNEAKQLEAVIALFPCFEKKGLGRTSLIKHSIDVGDAKPIKQRFYPVSPAVEKLMFGEIDRMLELGVIEPSTSAWSSPMRLVVKPNKVRLCLDARKLNSVTKKDAYPLPNIEGIFSRLPKANFISKLDLKDAFWQIGLDEPSKQLTAFTVPGRPLYQFVVMPFGLCNAPQTMCRLMDELIPPDLRHTVFGYLDDMVIVSEDFDNHIQILMRIATQFRKANLTLNVAKSKFFVSKTNYLGYVIGNGGITTDPDKISAIINWPEPKNIKQVRGFLGICGWYRRFIKNFSTETFPITEVVSTKRKFKWTPEAQQAFERIKSLLTSAPVLNNPDFSKKFYLHCDASDFGIGAVLVQLDGEGNEKPIAFMSKKLNTSQRNYSVTERECLAALEAIKKFRCYLELQEFEVVTDHSSLMWLMRQPDLSGRLARWVFKLQPYRFSISHRKGKDHIVPDALSRIPNDEISALEICEPGVNLDSPYFDDEDYCRLKKQIRADQNKYPDIKIIDRFIYYRTENYSGDEIQEQNSWKLWIPSKLRKDIISNAHDVPVAAHGGMAKTLELLRRTFFWPGMVRDVREYIRNCEVCKMTKASNIILKPPMGQLMESVRPFQRLYVDLLGPYPRSKSGHIGLLIVLDHLSKFHWLCPLRKFTATPIKDFLLQHIFHVYGVPECIVSDNGSQFRSNELNAFLTELGINHIYTALYSPQSNASERVNRSLIAGIRAYLKNDHKQWDQNLSSISCALRNAYHQTINCSPYHALYGFDMITHGSSYELLRKLQLLEEPSVKINKDDSLQLIRKDLRQHIKDAYEKNQHNYNLRTRIQNFAVGQVVYRRNFAQSSAEKSFNSKLSPVFVKSRIKEKLGNHYYLLEDVEGKTIGTYHGKDIRM